MEIFLESPKVYCRPFMDFNDYTADDILMYSDSAKQTMRGFGAFCENDWMSYSWEQSGDGRFIEEYNPSIQYLELFGVTAAVLTWIHRFANRRIWLFCDNDSVVKMINKNSSKCKNCMVLIRKIIVHSMIHNVRVFAKWVSTDKNVLADALSRGDFIQFWENAPETMNHNSTEIPSDIWPVQKLWIK